MATKKKTRKKRVGGVRKYVLIRVGRKVYRANLSALGRPLADPELLKLVLAFEKKHKKCCHGLHFGGVFNKPMYMMSFGNGHLPH